MSHLIPHTSEPVRTISDMNQTHLYLHLPTHSFCQASNMNQNHIRLSETQNNRYHRLNTHSIMQKKFHLRTAFATAFLLLRCATGMNVQATVSLLLRALSCGWSAYARGDRRSETATSYQKPRNIRKRHHRHNIRYHCDLNFACSRSPTECNWESFLASSSTPIILFIP